MYDFYAIVGAVGGALGLFLGFSFHGCLIEMAKYILSKLYFS